MSINENDKEGLQAAIAPPSQSDYIDPFEDLISGADPNLPLAEFDAKPSPVANNFGIHTSPSVPAVPNDDVSFPVTETEQDFVLNRVSATGNDHTVAASYAVPVELDQEDVKANSISNVDIDDDFGDFTHSPIRPPIDSDDLFSAAAVVPESDSVQIFPSADTGNVNTAGDVSYQLNHSLERGSVEVGLTGRAATVEGHVDDDFGDFAHSPNQCQSDNVDRSDDMHLFSSVPVSVSDVLDSAVPVGNNYRDEFHGMVTEDCLSADAQFNGTSISPAQPHNAPSVVDIQENLVDNGNSNESIGDDFGDLERSPMRKPEGTHNLLGGTNSIQELEPNATAISGDISNSFGDIAGVTQQETASNGSVTSSCASSADSNVEVDSINEFASSPTDPCVETGAVDVTSDITPSHLIPRPDVENGHNEIGNFPSLPNSPGSDARIEAHDSIEADEGDAFGDFAHSPVIYQALPAESLLGKHVESHDSTNTFAHSPTIQAPTAESSLAVPTESHVSTNADEDDAFGDFARSPTIQAPTAESSLAVPTESHVSTNADEDDAFGDFARSPTIQAPTAESSLAVPTESHDSTNADEDDAFGDFARSPTIQAPTAESSLAVPTESHDHTDADKDDAFGDFARSPTIQAPTAESSLAMPTESYDSTNADEDDAFGDFARSPTIQAPTAESSLAVPTESHDSTNADEDDAFGDFARSPTVQAPTAESLLGASTESGQPVSSTHEFGSFNDTAANQKEESEDIFGSGYTDPDDDFGDFTQNDAVDSTAEVSQPEHSWGAFDAATGDATLGGDPFTASENQEDDEWGDFDNASTEIRADNVPLAVSETNVFGASFTAFQVENKSQV
jgi:hypothetical protein